MPDNPKSRKFSFRIFFIFRIFSSALLVISIWATLSLFAAWGRDEWLFLPDSLFGVLGANVLFWTLLKERVIVITRGMIRARKQHNIKELSE
jgi:hypothetical protein